MATPLSSAAKPLVQGPGLKCLYRLLHTWAAPTLQLLTGDALALGSSPRLVSRLLLLWFSDGLEQDPAGP